MCSSSHAIKTHQKWPHTDRKWCWMKNKRQWECGWRDTKSGGNHQTQTFVQRSHILTRISYQIQTIVRSHITSSLYSLLWWATETIFHSLCTLLKTEWQKCASRSHMTKENHNGRVKVLECSSLKYQHGGCKMNDRGEGREDKIAGHFRAFFTHQLEHFNGE